MRGYEEQLRWEEDQNLHLSKLTNEELRLFAFSIQEEKDELEQLEQLVAQEAAERYIK